MSLCRPQAKTYAILSGLLFITPIFYLGTHFEINKMQIIKKMLNKKIKEVLAMLPVMNRNREFMPGLLEDFFKTDLWPDLTNKNRANTPAVNVSETDKEYKIDVTAPGLNKNNYKIDLEDNILTISSEKEEKN